MEKKLDASDIDFPQLDMEYLETVACGTYQLKQAPGYVEKHTTEDGDYQIWVYQYSDDLIRGQIQSRHKFQTKYYVWIQYDKNGDSESVKEYFVFVLLGRGPLACAHISPVSFISLGTWRISHQ